MPVILFTPGELFEAARDACHAHSEEILKLSDLNAKPLDPGESVDARRHRIAKLGKKLAEAFVALEQIIQAHREAHGHADPSDVTAGAPHEPDKETN